MQKNLRKILIMDDDIQLRNLLKKMLKHLKFEAEVTKDGAEAIIVYREAMERGEPFDAIIVDLNIPNGMGGIETVRILKEIEPNLRAIISSGELTEELLTQYNKYGFESYIEKPVRMDLLKSTIEKVLV